MRLKMILFDLDGTLLPMDQEIFIKAYFKGISEKAKPHGYEPSILIETIWAGTAAMIKNDGCKTNMEAFWQVFARTYGEGSLKDIPVFDEFYSTDFQKLKDVCGYQPKATALIHQLRKNGMRVGLATNPIFPKVATDSRIRWAGLEPHDFEVITTYENASHCKPNLDYYKDILAAVQLDAEDCLMVGNDVAEDMVAAELGMQVFLLTDCLINKPGKDLSIFPHGNFDDMVEYMKTRLHDLDISLTC